MAVPPPRSKLIPTFSPQGDGNVRSRELPRGAPGARVLIPTFSPQGDGNQQEGEANGEQPELLIPTFSPQGDGNGLVLGTGCGAAGLAVDPYLFPARGRKQPSSYES